jgi:hypothetical protein
MARVGVGIYAASHKSRNTPWLILSNINISTTVAHVYDISPQIPETSLLLLFFLTKVATLVRKWILP